MQSYNDVLKRNQRIFAATPKVPITPIFYAFLGLAFVIWGLTSRAGILDFTVIIGAGFLVFAVACYLQTRKVLGRQR